MGILDTLFGRNKNKPQQTQTETPKPSETYVSDTLKEYEEREARARKAADVDGKHYTDTTEEVKQLKRDGKIDEAIELLLKSVEAVEAEAQVQEWQLAPWYYNQLAICYRKKKEYQNEIEILERFIERQYKWSAPEVREINRVRNEGKDHAMNDRIVKAKELLAKSQK